MAWVIANLGVLLNGVAVGLLLFMMAVGLTILLGLLNVLNLAHGSFFLVGAYLGYRIAGETAATWGSFVAAVGVAMVLGGLLGIGLMMLMRPLIGRGHMDEALLTLGLALVISELLLLTFGKDDHAMAAPGALAQSVRVAGSSYPAYRLAVIVVGVVVAAAVWYVLERTSAGAVVRATVADPQMVEAVGISVRNVALITFGVASALAVGSGVLAAPIKGASAGLGTEILLLALVVIVVGGVGSVGGTMIGALIIGMVENLGVVLMPATASFLLFGAMALIITFRPGGLFPNSAAVGR
ncbi:branched-chain amino acid ABC transporter permease [Nitriliruptor alkaliphilus]|uniref:branched-chain amino acid ABC transporter permease n=1 Tax=Nitriliruptor alkaliphilus TaxID=427918 RepID=UPI0006974AF2|nr:branched-chain amino acid ABC transporter permease [Nitriliruptor alkaliphilus]